jgi:hypothetical protein
MMKIMSDDYHMYVSFSLIRFKEHFIKNFFKFLYSFFYLCTDIDKIWYMNLIM